MKNIFKLSFLMIIATFLSCIDDDNGTINTDTTSALVLLNPEIQGLTIDSQTGTSADEALKLTWDNFTSSTVSVEMALTSGFENVQTFTPTASNYLSMSFNELNTAISNLGGLALADNTVYFRVKAGEVISNSINFNVVSSILPSPSPILTAPSDGDTFTVNPAEASNIATTATWTFANDSDLEITYNVEVALAGTSFASPVSLGTVTDANSLDISFLALNNAAIQAGIDADTTGDLDLRVTASYTDNGTTITSESEFVTITVTPTFILPRLAVPGNHQGWQPDESIASFVPYIAASAFGATDYEGFMWLDGEYKYVEPNAEGKFVWGNTDWEDDGSFSGLMSTSGPGNFPGATAGYYLVRGDTSTGLYSREVTNWGIIGAATPTGWGSDTDMTYDNSTRVWTITIALTAGEYKFRANDDWVINLGTDNDNDGSLDFGGPNFSVDTAGTYLVTLDLSSPRQYMVTAELQ